MLAVHAAQCVETMPNINRDPRAFWTVSMHIIQGSGAAHRVGFICRELRSRSAPATSANIFAAAVLSSPAIGRFQPAPIGSPFRTKAAPLASLIIHRCALYRIRTVIELPSSFLGRPIGVECLGSRI